MKFSSLGSDRVRFVLDKEHPTLASHHQKIVVIDDTLAFSGGLDLTQRRWDTPEHLSVDNRRVDPGGHAYGPFHDVQICVQGEAAKSLGQIARERWKLATKEEVVAPEGNLTVWPDSVAVDLEEVEVGIARTLPAGLYLEENGEPSKPTLEIERLFLDSIRKVERFAYIENQYFTSPIIAKAIAKRLEEKDGPEFVMVLPRDQTGWIEESTMGLLRSQALKIVRDADRFGRFRCYYPIVPGLSEGYVKVHSKVMVLDDEFVRIGSANLNSRSMGLDTECDLVIEAHDRTDIREAAASLRSKLLAEHLGISPEQFEEKFINTGSLVLAVESFLGGPRTLLEMLPHVPEWVEKIAPPMDWIDPSGPNGIRRWFRKRLIWNRKLMLAAACVFALVLAVYFFSSVDEVVSVVSTRFRELTEWFKSWNGEKVASEVEKLRGSSFTVPLVILGFVVASLIFIPVLALIVGVALSFPPLVSAPLALAGALAASLATYGIGRYWAYSKSRFLTRPWVKRVSFSLRKGGVWTVTAARLMPVAPFSVVGIVSGGLRIPLKDFVLGTIMGMSPGILAISFLSNGAVNLAANSTNQKNWLAAAVIALCLLAIIFLFQYLVRRLGRTPQ